MLVSDNLCIYVNVWIFLCQWFISIFPKSYSCIKDYKFIKNIYKHKKSYGLKKKNWDHNLSEHIALLSYCKYGKNTGSYTSVWARKIQVTGVVCWLLMFRLSLTNTKIGRSPAQSWRHIVLSRFRTASVYVTTNGCVVK